jgi:hypothetical protein
LESEAVVIQTEAAGLLYGIVWEEKHQGSVALYMKMEDVFKEVREGTGLEVAIELEVPDAYGHILSRDGEALLINCIKCGRIRCTHLASLLRLESTVERHIVKLH